MSGTIIDNTAPLNDPVIVGVLIGAACLLGIRSYKLRSPHLTSSTELLHAIMDHAQILLADEKYVNVCTEFLESIYELHADKELRKAYLEELKFAYRNFERLIERSYYHFVRHGHNDLTYVLHHQNRIASILKACAICLEITEAAFNFDRECSKEVAAYLRDTLIFGTQTYEHIICPIISLMSKGLTMHQQLRWSYNPETKLLLLDLFTVSKHLPIQLDSVELFLEECEHLDYLTIRGFDFSDKHYNLVADFLRLLRGKCAVKNLAITFGEDYNPEMMCAIKALANNVPNIEKRSFLGGYSYLLTRPDIQERVLLYSWQTYIQERALKQVLKQPEQKTGQIVPYTPPKTILKL